MAFAAAAPGTIISLALLWTGAYSAKVQWTLTVLVLTVLVGFAFALRERIVIPLQTISNLLAALGEGDFSIRARGATRRDPLGQVMVEVNALVDILRDQRLDALEATTLLRKVMAEIDVAVFTFDAGRKLKFVNRAAADLLRRPAERLLGLTAGELGLDECLDGDSPRVLNATFPAGPGRWEIRRSEFRQGGRPHELLVLSDLSRVLRDEERQAWQRLIRVIGHEMNNSLAPIKSIAGSLSAIVERTPPPPDWQDDLRRGLSVIASRSGSLSRFMTAYAQLARLPAPRPEAVDVPSFVARIAGLDPRLQITVVPGPPAVVHADRDQLEQLLINLVRNAVDAALTPHHPEEAAARAPAVTTGWQRRGGTFELWVEDNGPGLANTSNLFVPFYTTKPQGSGIGLVLSRQIAEAHGGTVTLDNRSDARGCRATVRLPLIQ